MNINFKKLISALLVAVMVFCSAPLSGFVGLELPEFNLFKADAAEENIKNTITTTEVDTMVYPTLVPTTAESTDTVVSTTKPTGIMSGVCGDNLTWTLDVETGVLTIAGTGDMWNWHYISPWCDGLNNLSVKSVILPDGLTSIGNCAFKCCYNVLSVTIPDGVTHIGDNAFSNCGITNIIIPGSVKTIGSHAFNGCDNLESVMISDGVKSIASGAFSKSHNLKSVTLPDSITTIAEDLFYGCRSLTSITIPDSVTSIGINAFEYCGLTSITIPDSVTSIGGGAFSNCNSLTSITIPDNVTSIGDRVFVNCKSLESIKVDPSNPEYSSDERGVLFDKEKTKLIQYPLGNEKESYEIPDGVISIGNGAFSFSNNLKNITIPDSVTSIGENAFYYCGLTSITIPDSVTSIGDRAFNNCFNLESIKVDSSNSAYSSDEHGVLFNKEKTKLIQYPLGNKKESYEIPDSVISIGDNAFNGCNNIARVTIPDSVTTIGYSVFWGCDSLQYIHLPTTITEIGDDIPSWTKAYICAETEDCYAKTYADKNGIKFKVCNGIHYENLPEIVTGECGDNLTWTLNTKSGELIITGTGDMWESCTSIWYPYRDYIKTVVVEDGVTSIGKDAFHFFDNLKSITIPDSVTSIGDYAVMGCTNLETVTLGKGIETIGESGISLCIELDSLIIHEGVTAIGDWAFAYNSSLEYVHFPKSVTEIGENIFDTISPYICAETKDCYAKKYADKNGIEFRLCADHREVPDVNDKICGENLTWSLDIETGILTISGTGDMYNYSVSEAAPWYSHQPYIKSVVIKDGATSIGNYAFTDLPNLTKVTMADTVLTIGESAFEDCISLKNAEISKNAVSIGKNAFYKCQSLTSAIIPDSVTQMGSSAFGFCDALESVIIGDGLESISGHCFYSCGKLKYIEIGSNVTKIGSNSFAWCDNLKTVVLPKSLESIAAYAFDFCNKLNSVYYEGTWEEWCEITFGYYNSDLLNASIYCNASAEDVPEDGSNPDNSGNKLEWNVNKSTGTLYINGTGAMDDYSEKVAPWYIYQSQVNTIVIGEGITSVGDYAFYDFVSVTDVILPESMINIGDHAFEDCEILEYINFGNKVKTIGQYAFCNCDNLRDVTIPNSVISLGASAFSFSGVENLSIGKGLKEISTYAFYDCDNLRNLIIGENVETISTEAFAISSNLKNVFIPSDVTKIQDSAFDNCYNITDVYYEGSEKDWEAITFGYNNSSLLRATIHFGASADDIVEEETTMSDFTYPDDYPVETTTKHTGPYTTGVIVYPTTTGVAYPDTETTVANTTGKYPSTTASLTTNATTAEAVVTLKPGQTVIDEGTTKAPVTTKKPSTTKVPATTTTTKPAEDVHTHTSQLIVIPATCTVNGMKDPVCRDCGEPIGETTILQAKGHSAGEWLTVVEPTTESVGKQVRNCTICGEKVDEREIPKLSTVVDKKTGVEMNFNSADYDGEVEIIVKEVFDGKAFDVVDTSVISSQKFIYDITMTVDGSETQPEGKVTIRIPLPEGYDSAKTFVYHVDSSTGKIEKMQAEYVDGYLVFETTHFSYYAVVESADISMKIRQPSTTTVNYGETLVLHADLGGKTLPDGYKIKWFTNSDGVTIKSGNNGTSCEVTSVKNGSVTVTARIVDKNGNEVKGADGKEISASQTIESKVSIWLRIVSFFKNLFGSNRIIAQTILGK